MATIHKYFIIDLLVKGSEVDKKLVSRKVNRKNGLMIVSRHRFSKYFYRTDIFKFYDNINCHKMAEIIYRLDRGV